MGLGVGGWNHGVRAWVRAKAFPDTRIKANTNGLVAGPVLLEQGAKEVS